MGIFNVIGSLKGRERMVKVERGFFTMYVFFRTAGYFLYCKYHFIEGRKVGIEERRIKRKERENGGDIEDIRAAILKGEG